MIYLQAAKNTISVDIRKPTSFWLNQEGVQKEGCKEPMGNILALDCITGC